MTRYLWQHDGFPEFFWDDQTLRPRVEAVASARAYLHGQLDVLGLAASAVPLIEEVVTSAAIEGEAISRRDVRSSVAQRLGLDTAGLPPAPRAVDGMVELLLDATTHAAEPMTRERLLGWQAALFPSGYAGLTRVRVGAWRDSTMEVVSGALGRLPNVHFIAPPPKQLDAQVARLLDWLEGRARTLPGVIAAGLAHLWFETLHPFDDGNGRVGRALAELVLARADGRTRRAYSLSAQILRERDDYYRALEAAQRGALDITPWLDWFCACVERALRASIAELGTAQHRARFWRRVDAQAEVLPRQRRVLDRLLEAGPGGFAGGLSNRNYCRIAKVAAATAARDLTELVTRGLLSRRGGGRSTRYELVWQLAAEESEETG